MEGKNTLNIQNWTSVRLMNCLRAMMILHINCDRLSLILDEPPSSHLAMAHSWLSHARTALLFDGQAERKTLWLILFYSRRFPE